MKSTAFVIRYRTPIILLTVLILAASAIPLFQMKINPDLESYLPETMPSIVNNRQLEEVFGKSEPLLIIFAAEDVLNEPTLLRLRAVSEELVRQEEFSQVLSLFQTRHIRGDAGMMVVDPAIPSIPKTADQRDQLRTELLDNPLASGLVVSEDFRFALILTATEDKNQDNEIIALVDSILQVYPGNEQVWVGGQVFLRAEANEKISRDLLVLLPIAILIMLLFLWISFRELKAVFLPFGVVVISIAVSLGLIPLLGWELSIIGVLIPIMMVAIANNYGVHFMARYQELNARNRHKTMHQLVAESVAYLNKPILLTGLTTMVGIMGLVVHILLPAKQMGIVVAAGIGLALVLSLTFIPSVLSGLSKGKPHDDLLLEKKGGWLSRTLHRFGQVIDCCPRLVLLVFGSVLLVIGSGLFRLQVAADFDDILPRRNSFNQVNHIVNEHFGGAKTIQVSFSGDMKDPEILQRIDQYARQIETLDGVERVTSLSSVIRLLSQSIYTPDESGYDQIPASRAGVAQLLELYNMSGDPEDFEQIVDFPYENSLLTVQFQGDGLSRINGIQDRITEWTKDDPNLSGIAGFSLVEKELCETIAVGQIYSLLFALAAILLLLIVIFRSWTAGWVGIIPLLFAVISTFGIMGWLGIELDIVTALLSSISIGLGVDYTIHMYWRLIEEMRNGNSLIGSVQASLETIGRAVSINAFAVMIGFAVLLVSGFPLVRIFGLLIILSLLFCLLGALLLVPVVLVLIRPRFLLGKAAK